MNCGLILQFWPIDDPSFLLLGFLFENPKIRLDLKLQGWEKLQEISQNFQAGGNPTNLDKIVLFHPVKKFSIFPFANGFKGCQINQFLETYKRKKLPVYSSTHPSHPLPGPVKFFKTQYRFLLRNHTLATYRYEIMLLHFLWQWRWIHLIFHDIFLCWYS